METTTNKQLPITVVCQSRVKRQELRGKANTNNHNNNSNNNNNNNNNNKTTTTITTNC